MTDNEVMLLAMRRYRSDLAEQARMKEYIVRRQRYFSKTDEEITELKEQIKGLAADMEQCDRIIQRNEHRRRRTWA